jgi:hypothetical protein
MRAEKPLCPTLCPSNLFLESGGNLDWNGPPSHPTIGANFNDERVLSSNDAHIYPTREMRQRKSTNAADAETKRAPEKPVLLEAIDMTLATFEDRGRLYRNLVVAVSLVSLGSILTALLCWRGLPLAGLIIVVPLTGAFIYLDTRRVSAWRNSVLSMCRTRGLDLALFCNTVSQLKHLPQGSLQSMLATLPVKSPGALTQEGPSSLRNDMRMNSEPDWKLLVGPAALTLALVGVTAALHWQSLWPLAVTIASAVLFVLSRKGKPS